MLSFFSKTDNKILWLLKVFLAAPLLLPLFVSESVIFSYTAPKGFAFRILVEIAAVFYLYLALKHPKIFCHSGRSVGGEPESGNYRFGCQIKSGATIKTAVLVFLTVWLVAALAGVDFYHSFWGDMERMIGVWGLAHFVVWFLMLIGVFRSLKDWKNLLKISVGASSLVALTAIIQKFTGFGLLMPQAERVYGTIGNAAFLATYLIFNIFFVGYLLFETILSRKKILFAACPAPSLLWCGVYCLLFVFNLIALFLTGTRGAMLGLLAGVVVLLLAGTFFQPVKKWRRYFLAALILIFILGALFFALRHHSFIQNNGILGRLASISLKDITAQNRLILWQRSWQAWQEKPWLGWGPENYEAAVNKYFDSRLSPYEAWFDRAHNFIFDYGTMTGWLGLASYSGLFGAAIWRLKKIAKENFYFSAVFGSLLAAYLIQNFFVFDIFVSYLMLFLALGAIEVFETSWRGASLSASALKEAPEKSRDMTVDRAAAALQFGAVVHYDGRAKAFYKKIIFACLAGLIIFSLYSFNLKPLLAGRLGSEILSWQPAESEQKLNSALEDALALNTFASDEVIYQAAIDYLAKASAAPQLTQNENFYILISGELLKIIGRSPAQLRNYIALGWLNLYFSDRHKERIDSAISLAKKAKELAPVRKESYQILVAAYSISGEPQKAQEIVGQAQALDKGLGEEVRDYWRKLK
jgi:O-antigen ligase